MRLRLLAPALVACTARPAAAPPAPPLRAVTVALLDAAPDVTLDVIPDSTPAVPARDAAVDAAPLDAPHAGEALRVLSRQVAVYFEPRVDPAWSGALRAGAELRVRRGPLGELGCPPFEARPDTGWYELEAGGYVCASRGAMLARHLTRALRAQRPARPRLDAALPYRYAAVTREAVLYRALPTPDDEALAEPDRVDDPAPDDGGAAPDDAAPRTLEELEGWEGTPVLRRLTRSMFVSLDRAQASASGARYWRTHSGGWVRASDLRHVGASSLRGVRLGAGASLPLRFVVASGASRWARDDAGAMRRRGRLARWAALTPAGEAVTWRAEAWVPLRDGGFAREADTREVSAHSPPDDLAPGERWIDVNLDRQSVVAYEGAAPVFATLMSSGLARVGDARYETVQGAFRVTQKHVTATMDGNSAAGAYSIEDVPWVMYFHESFALHGAFWHDGFGAPRSHGCVNLSPDDARWLFHWSAPALPEAWHSVWSAADDPGTRVYVHYERQRLGEHGGPDVVPGH